jgi:replication factor C small subunit
MDTLDQSLFLEKHRPPTLDEVIGHKNHIRRLKRFVKRKNLPHCIFSGPQGVGKTTVAIALARDLFGDYWDVNFMELNASDARGIDTVRNQVKKFAESVPLNSADFPWKIMFLDEADELTKDAQAALRRTMETYAETCRFILSCNWSNKLIRPIQSRCSVFRFTVLTEDDLKKIIKSILKEEEIEIEKDEKKDIIEHLAHASDGDARVSVNTLQELSYIKKKNGKGVTLKDLKNIIDTVDRKLIKSLFDQALGGDFQVAAAKVDELIYNYGYSGEEILEVLASIIEEREWEGDKKMQYARIVYKMAQVDARLNGGRSERLQLRGLIGYIGLMEYVLPGCPKLDVDDEYG